MTLLDGTMLGQPLQPLPIISFQKKHTCPKDLLPQTVGRRSPIKSRGPIPYFHSRLTHCLGMQNSQADSMCASLDTHSRSHGLNHTRRQRRRKDFNKEIKGNSQAVRSCLVADEEVLKFPRDMSCCAPLQNWEVLQYFRFCSE